MSLRRCIIILSLFAWFAYVRGRHVDCERFPFYSYCRGVQTRKRFVSTEDNKMTEEYHPKPKLHPKYNMEQILTRLDKDLNNDDLLDAFLSSLIERRMNNSKRTSTKDRSKSHRTQDFLSQLNSMDNDY